VRVQAFPKREKKFGAELEKGVGDKKEGLFADGNAAKSFPFVKKRTRV
jgi:hypothetical protein